MLDKFAREKRRVGDCELSWSLLLLLLFARRSALGARENRRWRLREDMFGREEEDVGKGADCEVELETTGSVCVRRVVAEAMGALISDMYCTKWDG